MNSDPKNLLFIQPSFKFFYKIQLKQQIIKLEKEIKLLKVENIKNDDHSLRTKKIIEEVLSQSEFNRRMLQ